MTMRTAGRVRAGMAALVAAGLLATASPASATLVIPMDLPGLVSGARTIVHGRVVGQRTFVADGRTETAIFVDVQAYLKGEGGREIAFRVPGGLVGRYRTVVAGAPVLHDGDEIVVFLSGAGEALPVVVGFSQGVLRVLRDSSGLAPHVIVPPAPASSEPQRVVRGDLAGRVVPLARLAEDVRAIVARGAGASGDTTPRRPSASKPGDR